MQNVSETYKQSMKAPLRERAFMKLSFNLTGIEAQSNAFIEDNGQFAYYSNKNIFGKQDGGKEYATLELGFTKVDGSMFFPPREQAGNFYNASLVSKGKVRKGKPLKVSIRFNSVKKIDLQGLIITFDEINPARDFDVMVNDVLFESIKNNNKGVWSTERQLKNVSSLTFLFYSTYHRRNTRLRIYSIEFGYTLNYDNDSILSSSLDSYISPISENVPQIDFSIQIKNHDGHFNIDNPNSIVRFFENGQKMDVEYGYQLPDSDNIEWIRGAHLLCSSWEVDDAFVTIRGEDVFRKMDSDYVKGFFIGEEVRFYELAERVLKDIGVSKYYLDPILADLKTKNAIPRVKHKEALQMIANACGCTLFQSRTGEIQIKPFVKPKRDTINFTMTKSDMLSSPKTRKLEDIKEIVVAYHSYTANLSPKDEKILVSKKVQAKVGKIDIFYFDKPSHSHSCYLNNSSNYLSVKDEGSYFIAVEYKVDGEYTLEIKGRGFNVLTRYVTKTLNSNGRTIRWDNPLIDTEDKAHLIANMLSEYYDVNTEYEYDTRGNPELDVGDYIYQENDFQSNMITNVSRHSIRFNQAFGGRVVTRKIGE